MHIHDRSTSELLEQLVLVLHAALVIDDALLLAHPSPRFLCRTSELDPVDHNRWRCRTGSGFNLCRLDDLKGKSSPITCTGRME